MISAASCGSMPNTLQSSIKRHSQQRAEHAAEFDKFVKSFESLKVSAEHAAKLAARLPQALPLPRRPAGSPASLTPAVATHVALVEGELAATYARLGVAVAEGDRITAAGPDQAALVGGPTGAAAGCRLGAVLPETG